MNGTGRHEMRETRLSSCVKMKRHVRRLLANSVAAGDFVGHQDELKARMADDDRFFVEIYRRWRRKGWIAKVDPLVFASLPRVAMGIAQERGAMGEERYRQVVKLIIESVAERLSC